MHDHVRELSTLLEALGGDRAEFPGVIRTLDTIIITIKSLVGKIYSRIFPKILMSILFLVLLIFQLMFVIKINGFYLFLR